MDLETRVQNLESMVASIVETITNNKFYTDSDIAGVRKNVSELNNEVLPEWVDSGYNYYAGEKVKYDGLLYRCIQNHTSQPDWKPSVAVSLWVRMDDPAIEWPEWIQPTGAHDAYAKGDKVSHNDKHWISEIDANVYEPGVYGWEEA